MLLKFQIFFLNCVQKCLLENTEIFLFIFFYQNLLKYISVNISSELSCSFSYTRHNVIIIIIKPGQHYIGTDALLNLKWMNVSFMHMKNVPICWTLFLMHNTKISQNPSSFQQFFFFYKTQFKNKSEFYIFFPNKLLL